MHSRGNHPDDVLLVYDGEKRPQMFVSFDRARGAGS